MLPNFNDVFLFFRACIVFHFFKLYFELLINVKYLPSYHPCYIFFCQTYLIFDPDLENFGLWSLNFIGRIAILILETRAVCCFSNFVD